MSEPIIDSTAEEVPADAVPDEAPAPERAPSTELAVAGHAGAIISAQEPAEILAKAHAIAKPLADLIEKAGLAKNLGGNRKHVEVGGWQAAGTMLGALGGQPLHAETVWTRPVPGDDGRPRRTSYTATVKRYHRRDQGGGLREETTYDVDGYDWEACVEVRTPAGVVVGRAEAMCSRAESTWATRDDYALRSMAETRAESRAFRRAIGWIVHLAGYNPTPAEEMPPETPAPAPLPWWAAPASDALLASVRRAVAHMVEADTTDAECVDVLAAIQEDYGQNGMPAIAARAVLRVAVAARERAGGAQPAEQTASTEGGTAP